MGADHSTAPFTRLADLASARLGGRAIAANDDFFAPKSNLVKPEAPVYIPGKYTARGKWMDGWESRRQRTPGNDWCIVALGVRGVIHGVNVNTRFFTGNYPSHCSIDAFDGTIVRLPSSGYRPSAEGRRPTTRKRLAGAPPRAGMADGRWATGRGRTDDGRRSTVDGRGSTDDGFVEILPKSALRGDADNFFTIEDRRAWTHLRLNIFPDGGVARLRVYGEAAIDWERLRRAGRPIDLASILNGGLVLGASDMHFGAKDSMIMPDRAKNMGDGWETRRRRDPGHDWAIIRLGAPGVVSRVEIDTNHYKGNYPESASLDACFAPGASLDAIQSITWWEMLPRTALRPHHRHFFAREIRSAAPASHIRLNIFPDGGISRLRVYGTVAPA